jgi:CcmD family protein
METANTVHDLFVAYSALWLIIGLFVLYLSREQRALARKLKEKD